ncbi:DUF4033 domain-containing protein [Caenorhabditis elegans]|uniref:DUF4033 domain-containing protein n=1 Tax=Caenorhabditis elegans TaxID=6239 RepID=F5GU81_CAEEL|nr:DUF4033 domain-containing protein [Caenorhabditis elegans]CCA65688.1 DUF4033 domain-containing protein [Caenorhabditis elegans]|eukprot:NP_001254252.1 Uncharacterized protein CELE_ZK666.11 [Caenorhabditis elegans]
MFEHFSSSQIYFILVVFSGFVSAKSQVFDCLGKCQCYPEYKIIQCPTGLRNQLGLTSKANIDGFQVNDNQKICSEVDKEFKVITGGTFKPILEKKKPRKGARRTKRDFQETLHK